MDVKRVTLRLDGDLHKALRLISVEDNTSLQDMFVQAIEEKYKDRINKSK